MSGFVFGDLAISVSKDLSLSVSRLALCFSHAMRNRQGELYPSSIFDAYRKVMNLAREYAVLLSSPRAAARTRLAAARCHL